MGLGVGLYHAADDGRELSFNGEEALEEGGCSLDTPTLVGRVGLEVMPVLGVEAEAVMVIVSLHAHLLA